MKEKKRYGNKTIQICFYIKNPFKKIEPGKMSQGKEYKLFPGIRMFFSWNS